MPVNMDKPVRWNSDVAQSVDMFNRWFVDYAPKAFRDKRQEVAGDVERALEKTENLTKVTPEVLHEWPGMLPALRMSTCPPLAVDRLIGLAGVPANVVRRMERNKLPAKAGSEEVDAALAAISSVITKMADADVFEWNGRAAPATRTQRRRAATIVADRLCGSLANPAIRNAQERRQLDCVHDWLEARGYTKLEPGAAGHFRTMPPGSYSFHTSVPVADPEARRSFKTTIDVAIMRKDAKNGDFPLLVEAKSAGDYTNTNKRRKEEARKAEQLRSEYGDGIEFILFLCGYFDSGFLGYVAADGIDWVWEHRIDDLEEFGI